MVNVPPESKHTSFMKNSRKYKNPKASRPYFQQSADEMVSTENHGENSSMVETSAPPAIAIVQPTARNPINLNSSVAPCKPGAPQQIGRIAHVQHIHMPVQISTLSPPPNSQQLTQPPPQGAAVWVEPAFHFGPGFEIHQSYCPTHSRQQTDQHIVMFYLSPGVAASFQIAGGHKILQGESLIAFELRITISSFASLPSSLSLPH